MAMRLAGWAARLGGCARRARAVAALVFCLGPGLYLFDARADIAQGVAWLQAQVQASGALATDSQVAAPQQARCETATTLLKLAGNSSQLAALVTALQEPTGDAATESLACWQQMRQQLGQSILARDVEARRANGQGYAPLDGFGVSTALDTGWVLGAQLNSLTSAEKADALAWLQSNQASDGSFSVTGHANVLTTAVVLRALNAQASSNSTAAAIASRAAAWLLARRSQGSWLSDVATTAVVYEAVQPYTGGDASVASSVNAYLNSQQQSDGSWAGDPYVTAVALRALALVSVLPLNPTQAGLKVTFVDARTDAAVPGVSLQAAGAGTFGATADASGSIQVLGRTPGNYHLSASVSGYATTSLDISLLAGQVLDLGTIQLVPPLASGTAVIAGTIRDQASGAVLAGATVAVQSQASAITSTNSSGNYLLSNVAPGPVTVRVSMAGYADATASLTTTGGQLTTFSPGLIANTGAGTECKIVGTILNASTLQPLQGVSVSMAGASTGSTSTGADGRFSLSGLASGLMTATATKSGFDSVSSSAQVSCSTLRTTAVDFSPKLYPAGQSPANANTQGLSGEIVDAGTDEPIPGAQLVFIPDAGGTRSTISLPDGSFSVSGLTGTTAQLQVQASGYQGVTLTYALAPLQTLGVGQVRLRAAGVTQLLPDLKVLAVRRSVQADAQTLGVQGTVAADIQNAGTESAPAGIAVYAFSDLNANKLFDADVEPVLGQATIPTALGPGQTATLRLSVTGSLPFRDAPIAVAIDPSNAAPELSKANNVASTADQSIAIPNISGFTPALKWKWTNENVQMAPVVGPLHDTNGDGKIDANDTPRVVFTSYAAGTYDTPNTTLRVLDGASGAQIWSANLNTQAQVGIVLADIDGDGVPEIIAGKYAGGFLVLSNNGAVKWQTASGRPFSMAVADIDGDGKPEIIFGNQVWNANGTLKFTMSGCASESSSYAIRFKSGSAGQQILCGSSAYDTNGTLLWGGPLPGTASAAPSVASFDHGSSANFIYVYNGKIWRLDGQGKNVWPQPVSTGGGWGGQPMLADLDGDGIPEIVVSGRIATTAFRADGSVMWQRRSSDGSESTTSSSFDFGGAGRPFVVYRDQGTLRVFDGPTGAQIYSALSSSATGGEYPVIVDVDGDGHADILVPGDSNFGGSQQGIYAYRDVNNAWVATRTVWNQYAYTISNINDDLSVPPSPMPGWQAYNTFLSNRRTDGDPRALPDLTTGYARVADGGGTGSTLTVRAGNAGAYKVPAGAKFAVYNADPALGALPVAALKGTAVLNDELAPGQWKDLTVSLTGSLANLSPTGRIWIVGDDDGHGVHALADFDRTNNTISANLAAIAANVSVGAAADRTVYTETDQAVFNAFLTNGGSFAQHVQVRFTVLGGTGAQAQVLALPAAALVPAGESSSVQLTWQASGVLAGSYQLLVELVSADGLVYASAKAPFAVQTGLQQIAGTRIVTDRVSYSAAQLVQITGAAVNLTRNTLLENLQAVTTVASIANQSVFSRSEAIGQLAPGGQRQYSYSLDAGALPAGSYQAAIKLVDAQGAVVSQSSANFTVLGTDATGFGLEGRLHATPSVVPIGQPVLVDLAAANNGGTALANTPVTIRIIEPASGAVIGSFTHPVASWPQGGSQPLQWTWASRGVDGQTVVAAASVNVAGRDVPLGQANIRLVGVPELAAQPVRASFGPIYVGDDASQAITITSIGSLAVGTATYSLSGSDPSEFLIRSGGCALTTSLPIGASCQLTIAYQPTTAATHSAQLHVGYGAGSDLAIELTGQAKPVVFTGTVAADAAQVEAGSTVGLSWSVTNPASVPASMSGSVSVTDAAGRPLASWPVTANAAANGISAGNQSFTTPLEPQTLAVNLSQVVGTGTVVLGTDHVTVIDPPVPVGLIGARKSQARVLVLVSCPPGLGVADDAGCVQARGQAIANYLTALGYANQVVGTGEEFLAQMRCGAYNTYWLSGGAIKLTAQTAQELREAIWRGDALWTDGLHDSRNSILYPAQGVTQVGKLPVTNQVAALIESGIYGSGSFATFGQITRFQLTTGQAQGLFTQVPGEQSPVPAVVANTYGQGKSLLFAFDLAAMITADANRTSAPLMDFIATSAGHAASAAQTLTIGDAMLLELGVTNQGTRTVMLQVRATLPAGLVSVGTAPNAQLTTQTDGSVQATWTYSSAAASTQTIDWQVRAAQPGAYSVPYDIYSVPAAGSSVPPRLRQSGSIDVVVTDPANLLQQAAVLVNALQPTANADRDNVSKARAAVSQALADYGQGNYEAAIAQWIAAADAIESIASRDESAAKTAISMALEATTDAACIQKCGSASCH